MAYLLEFVKGILLAFGVIVGFFIFIAWIMYKVKEKDEYEADDLVKPFEKYLEKIKDDEQYEEIKQVSNIICELKGGNVIDDVFLYKIKKDTAIHLKDEDGNTALRAVTNYIVIRKETTKTEQK